MSDLETLRALYEEWGRGDLSRTDIFDPDVESGGFGLWAEGTGTVSGFEALSSMMRDWLAAWERPLKVEAEEFIESGDRILVLIRWHGRGKGSGVEMEARGAHVWTFRDGRAVGFYVYRDRDEARASLESE